VETRRARCRHSLYLAPSPSYPPSPCLHRFASRSCAIMRGTATMDWPNERARGTRWRKGKATTRRPLPAPDTSHHRPSTHPAGLAPRRDGGALCPTVYSSETSLRSCPSRLIDGVLIFTLVFTRDTRPHQYGSTRPCPGNTHDTHALCAASGVMRGGVRRCLCRRLCCVRRHGRSTNCVKSRADLPQRRINSRRY